MGTLESVARDTKGRLHGPDRSFDSGDRFVGRPLIDLVCSRDRGKALRLLERCLGRTDQSVEWRSNLRGSDGGGFAFVASTRVDFHG